MEIPDQDGLRALRCGAQMDLKRNPLPSSVPDGWDLSGLATFLEPDVRTKEEFQAVSLLK